MSYEKTETPPYTTAPKATNGRGRVAPLRHQGESELRLNTSNADFDGNWLDRMGQLNDPRGYPSDIDSNIFLAPTEETSASKSIITQGSLLNSVEYFNRKLPTQGAPALIQALYDHYGEETPDGIVVPQVVQEAVDLLNSIPEMNAQDPLNFRQVYELIHGPIFDFMHGSTSDPRQYMNARIQEEQLKIRQDYLETMMGMRLPRFLVPDTTEFPYDPQARYLGLRLPYRRCLFILNPGVNARLVYGEQLDDDAIKLTVKTTIQGDAAQVGEFTYAWDGEQLTEQCWFSQPFDQGTMDEVYCILAILDGLSKNYVIAEGDPPPEGRKIPEARKGCTVRVVKLHPQAETIRKAWQGGTHASPREHMRRGHWRRNAKGEKIWIGQLVVNKGKTEGVVDKSYYVRKRKNTV